MERQNNRREGRKGIEVREGVRKQRREEEMMGGRREIGGREGTRKSGNGETE